MNNCTIANTYFDSTALKCMTCPTTGSNSVQLVPKSIDGLRKCALNFKLSDKTIAFFPPTSNMC